MTVKTAAKSKANTAAKAPAYYKPHRPASRKGKVHRIFDSEGMKAAIEAGERMALKTSTLKNWVSAWAREAKKSTHESAKKGQATKRAPKSE